MCSSNMQCSGAKCGKNCEADLHLDVKLLLQTVFLYYCSALDILRVEVVWFSVALEFMGTNNDCSRVT